MTKKEHTIDDVLFPVGLHSVFVTGTVKRGQVQFDCNSYRSVPGFQAVMAEDTGHVFAVVAQNYGLVTNRRALKLGEQCFRTVFNILKIEDMTVFNIIMPKTRSFCHVDFIHTETRFDLFENDYWFPYLRVTNSYNRMYALNFDLGFCRGICKNGVIFGEKNIEFKFHHTKSAKDPAVTFELKAGELKTLETRFVESLKNLKRFHVPPKMMWPLTCKVFGFKIAESPSERQMQIIEDRKTHISELSERYFGELGQNGYAALNVLTDYASRPVGVLSPEMSINGLQKKSGDWITDFVEAIADRDFSFENYLGEYMRFCA